MRRLLDEDARAGSLFGAHRGSVRIREGVELIAPALDVEPDALPEPVRAREAARDEPAGRAAGAEPGGKVGFGAHAVFAQPP
jgi:hypothetical protein